MPISIKLDTNSSLLRANDEFIKRYQATNFETIEQEKIKTTTIIIPIIRKIIIRGSFVSVKFPFLIKSFGRKKKKKMLFD